MPRRVVSSGVELPPRAWQRMLSGRRLDLLDPSPLDVEIEDIAHGLSRLGRWNGQTRGAHIFSVAQHAVLVEDLCAQFQPRWPARWQLAALLHDAAEYVTGDLISPFKRAVGMDYSAFEARLQTAVHLRFGLPAALPPRIHAAIKRADGVAARLEAVQFAGFSPGEARKFFAPGHRCPTRNLPLITPDTAKARFLTRFNVLCAPAHAGAAE